MFPLSSCRAKKAKTRGGIIRRSSLPSEMSALCGEHGEGRGTLANRSSIRQEENGEAEGGGGWELKSGTCLRTRLLSSSGVQSICAVAASVTSLLTLVVWLGALPTSRSFSFFSDMLTFLEGVSTLVGKERGAQNTCHVYCDLAKGTRLNYMCRKWEMGKRGYLMY